MSNDTECCAAYSDDCKLFAYSSPDGRLKIWDTESGALKQEYVPSSHLSVAATCLSWRGQSAVEAPRHRKQRARSSGGGGAAPLLALGTPAGSVLVYSVLAGDLQTELGGGGACHGGAAVHCVAWDAAGQHVFSGGADGHVLQWAVKNGKVKCKLKVGKSPVYSVCPLPDGATALAAGRTISWWELATGAQLRSYPGHATPVTYLQHVPLPGLDGDGGYFISAAAAGRVVSAWQLSRETSPGGAQPTASVSFALSAEPRQVSVARRPDGEAVLVTAVTATGLLHVFEKQLNGVRKKPVKPKLTVRVASDAKSPKPLPVLCARPGDEEPTHLHLCHGSFLRPAFERLPYETDEPSLCLVRADPAGTSSSAASAAVSRVKTPATDGPVRQLAAGLLSTGRKRRTSETAATPAPAQLPLEQRLGGLVAAAGTGRPTAPPSASSMAQLLVQGLASRDRAMLRTVLDTEEPAVVRSTVQALPLDAVLPLIDRLGHMLRFADQSFSALRWLRAVMERHSSYLLTQTDLDTVLAPVYSSVQVRLRCFPRLLQLRGRLELLAGQVAARQRKTAGAAATAEPAEPLFTYRDDSSDDEGDMLGRPPPSPDDVSEMSDDADLDDADDQAMEDEDGDDDGSEDEDGAEDPDEDDEDIEDSGDEDEDELMNGD